MFDVGFWELSLVSLVALLVVGPERLPKFARLAGFWLGKMRRTATSVRQEIRQELYADELKQSIEDSLQHQELKNITEQTGAALKDISKPMEAFDSTPKSSTDTKE